MTERILGPEGSKRRKRVWLVPLVIAAMAAIFSVTGAQAVHDAGLFELDTPSANATDASDNTSTTRPEDWDLICKANPSSCTLKAGYTAPAGTTTATASSHANDGNLNATIFTGGGSKDPEAIADWLWKDGAGGLPDKDNLLHAYAARYSKTADATCPSSTTTCEVIYFGSDRYDNSGDATQAFWFLQNAIAPNGPASQGGNKFTGAHRDGDLLIISEFSNGGTKSTITVYKWTGDDATGGLTFLSGGDNKSCAVVAPADPFCGIVNTDTALTTAPWAFLDKSGNTNFAQGEFFEAGINISDPSINLAGQCFSSFVAETRSSTSTTATLKDFVVGNFQSCGSATVTTPTDNSGAPTSTFSIGTGSVLVKDQAVVTVTGTTGFGGSVSFFLCKLDSGTCSSGGTAIGSAKPVTGASPVTVLSDAATVTSAGRYCWRAVYSGDAAKGVPGSSDSSSGECFTVNPVTPTLSTQAGTTPVNLGSPVSDTATLSGTSNKPGSPVINPTTAGAAAGGTITFTLYKADCVTLATGTGTNPQTVNVSGNSSYGPVSFTPDAPGTYHWVASYSGDLPNTNSTTHNTTCTTSAETVVVQQLNPTISTAQRFVPNDSATITIASSAAGDLAGSVRFRLYDNAQCTGTALHDQTVSLPTGSQLSKTVSTTNTTAFTTSTSFSWLVEYTSTNGGHSNVTSACNTENSSITINNG
jgi:hypothetical protein